MEMREQDGREEENAGDRDRERNLEREGTISGERRGVKEKNQPDCREEEREMEMRERDNVIMRETVEKGRFRER